MREFYTAENVINQLNEFGWLSASDTVDLHNSLLDQRDLRLNNFGIYLLFAYQEEQQLSTAKTIFVYTVLQK